MNRFVRILLLFISLWAGLFGRLHAQAPAIAFEHISAKEGLPGSAVYSIAKDRNGFMWFGTRRCPTRYDGETFRSFLFPETYLITGLAADSANQLWIASDRKGICRVDPHGLRLTPVPRTPQVTGNLFIDSRGEGWFSDLDGITRLNLRTGATRHYSMRRTSFFGLKATGFIEDAQHTLWVTGSDNGLFRFDRPTNRFVCELGTDCPDPKRRFQVYFSQGCLGTDGLLWVGSYTLGLLRYDPKTSQYRFFKPFGTRNDITCVQEGQDEAHRRLLWVGDEQGLMAFRPEQRQFFRLTTPLLHSFHCYTIYRDPANGAVWVGTSDGVLKYNPNDRLIQTVALPPSLVRQPVVVKVITADRRATTGQTFWLGLSHTGLLRWHRPTNRFTLVLYPGGAAETMWIDQPDDGRLWIGLRRWDYRGDGILVYDAPASRFVSMPAARRAGQLFTAPFVDHGFIDKKNRLWVGNNDEGLRVMDARTGQPLPYWPDSVTRSLHRNNNFLTDIAVSPAGRVWLATYQGPYYLTDSLRRFVGADNRPQTVTPPDDPATNSLLIARNGHVWAARWGSITESRPDRQLLTVLTARNGLFDRENRCLAEDQAGLIWIGNFEGLHAYNPRLRRLFRLTVSDGLSHNNTTHALYVHRDATLYIGQKNGFDYLNTRALARPPATPSVIISSFRVHEQERALDPARSVRLLRADNAFSVDFTTLTYSHMPKTQYAHRLAGLETNWTYNQTAHRAYYTNLSPGQYTLQLKATDSFGNWGTQVRQLSITVLPAYYETWWFRLLIAALVAGLLYGVYRYRISQLLRVQRIRNRISADLHDEIGSSLSSIGILGTLANQALPGGHPLGPTVGRIVSEVRQISSSLDDIVWSVNPRNDALSSLVARMNRYAAELFEASGIQYEISLPDSLNKLTLSMEKRQDFYLIFKETVTNLVKHARATHVRLAIWLTQDRLYLSITDNGVGFDAHAPTERNGLRNLRSRTQNLRGELTIDAAPGQGTTIQLSFPVHD